MGVNFNRFPVGQSVTVQEIHFGYLITPSGEGETGLRILEAGPEQLVLEDPADGSRKSIPMFFIHQPTPVPVPNTEAA